MTGTNVLLVGGVGLAAAYVPARRATRIDPVNADGVMDPKFTPPGTDGPYNDCEGQSRGMTWELQIG